MATRPQDLANAYVAVATANHYMVGVVGTDTAPITDADRERARAILISRENAAVPNGRAHRRLKLALDLLEHDERQATLRASRGSAADPAADAVNAGRETFRIVINLLTDNQLDFRGKSGRSAREQIADLGRRLGVDIHGQPIGDAL